MQLVFESKVAAKKATFMKAVTFQKITSTTNYDKWIWIVYHIMAILQFQF